MDPSSRNRFSRGFAIRVAESSENHHFGGTHNIEGAQCPNCDKSLIQHFVIDCTDERLGLKKSGLKTLPLLYCMRCELSWYDFVYDITSPDSITIIESYTDRKNDRAETLEEWNEEVGLDEFPRYPVELFEIPAGIEALFDKWNEGVEFTEEEEDQSSAFYSDYLAGGEKDYIFDIQLNQLCGRSILIQGLDDPTCGECKKSMPFLASLKSEKLWNLKICWDPVQIVFFFCAGCKRVHVQHSI